MEVNSQVHASADLSSGKEPQYPLNRRMGRYQCWSGHFGEENELLPLPAFGPWNVWAIVQPLYQLCYLRSLTLPICYHIWKKVWLVKEFVGRNHPDSIPYSVYFGYWAAALCPLLSQLSANGYKVIINYFQSKIMETVCMSTRWSGLKF